MITFAKLWSYLQITHVLASDYCDSGLTIWELRSTSFWTKLLSAPCIEKVILGILCHVWNMFIHLWHGHCRRGISRMRIWWKSNPLLKIALFHPCYFRELQLVVLKAWIVCEVHRVVGSFGFQSCGFHLCAFSKKSPNIQHMPFWQHKWKKSFTHAFLVTNDLSAANWVHADFWQT